MFLLNKPWRSQPKISEQLAPWARSAKLSYIWEYPQGCTNSYLRNMVDNTRAISADALNEFLRTFLLRGVGGVNSAGSYFAALSYDTSTTALYGCNALTLLVWFEFRSVAETHQQLNFRNDNNHSLDFFNRTANSVTWGCDWAGAWNGASQQTLSGLKDGDFVCVGCSMDSTGGRFFANGVRTGTKAGGPFTTSSTSIGVVRGAIFPMYGGAAFRSALPDSRMAQITANPWLMYRRPTTGISTAAAAITPPTLLTAYADQITTNSARANATFTRP